MRLQLLLRISQRKHLNNVTSLFFFIVVFFLLFFSIQTVAGSGYYGIESLHHFLVYFGASKCCQEPLVVRMASKEATTTQGKLR